MSLKSNKKRKWEPARDSGKPTLDARLSIMSAALTLFAAKGYDGTSVREIADSAGVNVALISYYFKGKERLYWTAIEQFFKQNAIVVSVLKQPANSSSEFETKLKLFVESFFSKDSANNQIVLILLREMQTARTDSVFFQRVIQSIHPLREVLVTFIKEGQKSGFVKKNLNPEFLVMTLLSMMLHPHQCQSVMQHYLGGDLTNEKIKNCLVNTFIEIFVEGVKR